MRLNRRMVTSCTQVHQKEINVSKGTKNTTKQQHNKLNRQTDLSKNSKIDTKTDRSTGRQTDRWTDALSDS